MNEANNSFRAAPTPNRSAVRSRRVIDAMPVELLRDGRGVYGIGVAEECDVEALTWACDVGASAPYVPRPLILRPDRLEVPRGSSRTAALQKILGRHPVFWNTIEEALRQIIHHEAVERAWPPDNRPDGKAWEAEYQRKFHGLSRLSVSLINRLIGQLIEEAADQDAMRAARRFSLRYREDIYRAAASHHRVLQLAETFPLAVLATCADFYGASGTPALGCSWAAWEAHLRARAATAVGLAKRGARLREVAAALEIPMALRRVKPGAAHLVTHFLVRYPDLLQWMPNETPTARIWLKLVGLASHRDVDFGRWVARHVSEMPGGLQQVGHTIDDLSDWVHANTEGRGRQLLTRRFTPSMPLRTAIQASHEWHEAVASHMNDAGDLALPPPWYPPATQGAFHIVPLTTSAELYREGHAMHHCVSTYVDQVRQGTSYIFSVRSDGKRIATIALFCDGETVSIQQLCGPCNAALPKAVGAAVRQWLRAQRTTAAAIRQQYEEWSCATQMTRRQAWARAAPDDFDDLQF